MEFYLQREGTGESHKKIPIVPQLITIGRSKSSTIVMKGKRVSKNQSIVRCQDGQVYIADDRSIHGTFLNARQIMSEEKVEIDDLIGFGVSPQSFKPRDEQQFVYSLKFHLNHEVDIKIKEEFDGFDPFADGEVDESMGDDIAKLIDSLRDDDEDEITILPIDEQSRIKDPLTEIFNDEHKSWTNDNEKLRKTEIVGGTKSPEPVKEPNPQRKTISLFDVIDTSPGAETFEPFIRRCTINLVRLSDNQIGIYTMPPATDFKRKRKRKAEEEPPDKRPSKRARVQKSKRAKEKIPARNTKYLKKPETKIKKQKNQKIIIVKASDPPEIELKKTQKGEQTSKQLSPGQLQPNRKDQKKKPKEKTIRINGLKKKTAGDDFPVKSKKDPSKKPATNGKYASPASGDEDSSVDGDDSPVKDFRVILEASKPLKSILSTQRKSQKTKKSVSFYHETFVKHFVAEAEDCIEITHS